MKITKQSVDALKPPTDKNQLIHFDDQLKGFGVRITRNGVKSYLVQKTVNGKSVRHTIGKHGHWTPDQARDEAKGLLHSMCKGVEPKAEKKRIAAQNQTLKELVAEYVEEKRTRNGPLRPSTVANCHKHLRNMFKDWADRPVNSITRQDCVTLFSKVSKETPANANHGFRVLKGWINYYNAKHETDDGRVAVNPVARAFRTVGGLKFNAENVRRTRIPLTSIGAVWSQLMKYSDPQTNNSGTVISADFVQFLILSGCRVSEAGSLEWSNVNLAATVPTFHLPATVTKTHAPLTHPISSVMRALFERRLAKRTEGDRYVFPHVRTGSKYPHFTDPRALLKKLAPIAGCHVHNHSLRRTCDDLLAECGATLEIRMQVLNHVASGIHERHYSNQNDPAALLPALQSVADYLTAQAEKNETENAQLQAQVDSPLDGQ